MASPYSSPNKVTQELRFLSVVIATGWLMGNIREYKFFSPISHTHPIATYCQLRGDWQFWAEYDQCVLSRCDEIWVLRLDGWQTSSGVTAELKIAAEIGLPVKYVYPNEDGTYRVEAA